MPYDPVSPTKLVLLMGVAGTGKTTVGRRLATELGWPYHEADDFHPAANKEKMGRGIPLDEADRRPWLDAIHATMAAARAAGQPAVFTCSALKAGHRQRLLAGLDGVLLVHLAGDPALLLSRLQARTDHFMKPGMLTSQLASLEPPADALTLDVALPPDALVAAIRRHLALG